MSLYGRNDLIIEAKHGYKQHVDPESPFGSSGSGEELGMSCLDEGESGVMEIDGPLQVKSFVDVDTQTDDTIGKQEPQPQRQKSLILDQLRQQQQERQRQQEQQQQHEEEKQRQQQLEEEKQRQQQLEEEKRRQQQLEEKKRRQQQEEHEQSSADNKDNDNITEDDIFHVISGVAMLTTIPPATMGDEKDTNELTTNTQSENKVNEEYVTKIDIEPVESANPNDDIALIKDIEANTNAIDATDVPKDDNDTDAKVEKDSSESDEDFCKVDIAMASDDDPSASDTNRRQSEPIMKIKYKPYESTNEDITEENEENEEDSDDEEYSYCSTAEVETVGEVKEASRRLSEPIIRYNYKPFESTDQKIHEEEEEEEEEK